MNAQIALQWMPGIGIVAVIAFFPLFFMKQHLALRIAAACFAVTALLFLFGLVLGHQFSFTRPEDLPPLFLGFLLGWLLAEVGRALRAAVARRRSS
jgi:hypothetical protein